jgi:hypothetical protein
MDQAPGGGTKLSYGLVTAERLLLDGGQRIESIPFRSLTAYAEGSDSHRYLMHLRHAPILRGNVRRASRLGPLLLGRNRYRESLESDTVLRFSRYDTTAARALRAELVRRGITRVEWTERLPDQGWPPSLLRRSKSG